MSNKLFAMKVRSLAILIGISSAGLGAQTVAQPAFPNFKTLVFLRGTCERLEIPGANLANNCRGSIVNMIYRDGRSSFAFTDGDRAMISFSGMGQNVAENLATQPVDHVSIATDNGASVKTEEAAGSCEFSNAFAGQAFVRCRAQSKSGNFFASFATDGSAPVVQEF